MNTKQLGPTLLPPIAKSNPVLDGIVWLDVTELARTIGFETRVGVSLTLTDTLLPLGQDTENDYDQRLYDALWLAHFQCQMNGRQATTFNVIFHRKEGTHEIGLRLRMECDDQTTFL